ncbi:MAG: M24 family metallopeptidase [Alicyclobacillus macrosporangiidus]|uniref:M24 family metallopeptidase n=1 Tax=Alicyclobacillus macrosporangiidus TaxID=392015 RepID=UPI0026F0D2B1|nr:M24 family metallopeptidase [Alicyclobacillus macrosporangiidus]MCL6599952.1 M24 family metallopeptidase [Alicyclobacillus macrosporangiidus]
MNKREQEFQTKLDRVRRFCVDNDFDAIVIASVPNFRWLTSGVISTVSRNSKIGDVTLYITMSKVYLLTNCIECPRLMERDMPGIQVDYVVFPWYRSFKSELDTLPGTRVASDIPLPHCSYISDEIRQLRYPMTDWEQERYITLGRDAASVVEDVAKVLHPGMTTREISKQIDCALIENDMFPIVSLVGADDFQLRYRHPIPDSTALHKTAMVVVCAERDGLVVALTRTVHFGPLTTTQKQMHRDVQWIHTAILTATRPGRHTQEIFRAIEDAYRRAGYPEEWKNHHQGGGIGYESRDFILGPDVNEFVHLYQAFAWNPSIPGYKSEDTFLLTQEGPVCVTDSKSNWPRTRAREGDCVVTQADILEL